MAYSKSELLDFGIKPDEIAEARNKIVGINIFDNIEDFHLNGKVSNELLYTKEIYQEYLELLKEFSKTNLEQILTSLKKIEIIDNHTVEKENQSLLVNYSETHHSTAINYLIKKLITEGNLLNDFIIKKAYEILMRGTSNENELTIGYRKNNSFFVGYFEANKKCIFYFPISNDEIGKAMNLFFDYYNNPLVKEEDLFVKPFILHGLLAALQVFPDGNTRLARTIQHIKLFELTNLVFDEKFPLPVIYFSKTCIPYRALYRDLITDIAKMPSEENWNNWIKFNLNRIQDQLALNTEQLKRTRKI